MQNCVLKLIYTLFSSAPQTEMHGTMIEKALGWFQHHGLCRLAIITSAKWQGTTSMAFSTFIKEAKSNQATRGNKRSRSANSLGETVMTVSSSVNYNQLWVSLPQEGLQSLKVANCLPKK